MKKTQNEMIRLQNVIESNRLNCSNDFNNLLLNDLSKVLSDYFDYKDMLTLDIAKEGGKYKIKISFTAVNLLRFGFLSKE